MGSRKPASHGPNANRREVFFAAAALASTVGSAASAQPSNTPTAAGPLPGKINVTPNDLSVVDGAVKIKSPQLATSLIKTQPQALEFINKNSGATKVKPSQISIDGSGQLIIDNKSFAEAVKNKTIGAGNFAKGSAESGNVICGNVSCDAPGIAMKSNAITKKAQ